MAPAMLRDAGNYWDHLPAAIAASDKVVVLAGQMKMLRSTDHGRTWEAVGDYFQRARTTDVAVDYSIPGGLYALIGWNVYRSGDQGKTWSLIKMWPSMHQIGLGIATFPKFPG